MVGCEIRLARRRGGLLHRSGSAAWPQEPCSLARVVITTAPWIDPVRNWGAGQVRGVERGDGVQGIEEQTREFVDLIFSSSGLGKNRVVLTTCSTKFPNHN